MRILAIIQARMSSRRLPGKILQPLHGKPMIQYLIERVEKCQKLDSWVLATSIDETDNPVAEFAVLNRFPLFRGPLHDVTRRCVLAAEAESADAILRLSGDSPFLDQAVIDRGTDLFRTGQWDLVTNVQPRTFPPGCSVEAVGLETLRRASESMPDKEREHVIRALYSDASLKVHNYEHSRNLSGYRLTVDNQAEFEIAERIVAAMTRPHTGYSIDEVVELGRSIGQLEEAA